ncbi:MAG: glycosyltransferase [Phycisphaerales bacterium JB038]
MNAVASPAQPSLEAPTPGAGRRVLFLGAFAPPRGGPNAQRVGAIAEYLSAWGWEIDLLALTTPEKQAIETAMYERLISHGARVEWIDKQPVASPWPWRIDGEQVWAEAVIQRVLERSKTETWDLVLATSPPFSALWAGYEISRQLDLPLVIDLQDPWSLAELWPYRSAVHLAWSRRLHRRLTRAAAKTVMNCEEAARAVREAFYLSDERVTFVQNGFAAGEVDPVEPMSREAADDRFRIVHIGTMMTLEGMQQRGLWPMSVKQRLSGRIRTTPAPTDTLAKSSYYLLQALRHGLDGPASGAERVHLDFVGPWSAADQRLVEELDLAAQVTVVPFSPRREAMARCKSADAVVLPLHTRCDGRPIRIVPSKTYDYLASGRPILCPCAPCDAWSFIENAGRGVRAEADDPQAIWQAIEELMERGESLAGPSNDPAVARFDWPNLIARLSRILDAVTPLQINNAKPDDEAAA